jgi:uncharacterized protein (DUF885 family)
MFDDGDRAGRKPTEKAMKRAMSLWALVLAGFALAASGAASLSFAKTAPGAATASGAAAEARFKAIYTAEWKWRIGKAGPHARPDNGRLDTVDAGSQQARLDHWRHVMKQLQAVDVNQLSPAGQVNYAVYRRQIADFIADQQFETWQMPFNSDSAFWSDVGYELHGDNLHTAGDFRKYLDRLEQIPRYFEQQIDDMKLGLARGFSVPRAVLDGRDKSIAAVADLTDPTKATFYKPFVNMPSSIRRDQQDRLRERARKSIATGVIPAYAKLLRFFDDDYVPHARTTLAAEALPDGKAYYRQQLGEYTTLDLSPDRIHRIGIEQVAKIHARMLHVMRRAGFEGSFADFLQFLRTDPRFYAKTPQELLDRTAWVAKEVDGKLSRFFDHLPRERFTIVPVPASIAPFYTSGRGGPDVYLVNTYDLKSRALYNMPALTLHESYPGHALQLELAEELTDLPAFRRDGYISAYGEGWALYSEFLGNEMGIYRTPYQEFGFLTYQMWRACRLVVDTGIHHMGWTRAQAVKYLHDNTALSDHEIDTEVDRYISWPAQADSYELGYLEIRKLRARAEKALGPKFDLRHFDDTILSMSSVPLPVLDRRIERFIAEGGPEPAWPCDCTKRRDASR